MSYSLLATCTLVAAGQLLLYLVYSTIRTVYFSKLLKIPGLPYGPIYGNVKESMVGEALDSSVSWVRKYGGVLRFYQMFGIEHVLVADPEAMRHVLVTNSTNYPRATLSAVRNLVPEGLISLEGPLHRSTRKLLNPSFNNSAIQGFLPLFHKVAQNVISKMCSLCDDSPRVNVQQLMKCATMDVIGMTAFDRDLQAVDDPSNDIVESLDYLMMAQKRSLLSSLPFYRCLPTRANAKYHKAIRTFDNYCMEMIGRRREQPGDNSNIVTKLLSARYDTTDVNGGTGSGLCDSALRDHVLTFLVAGHETTSYTLTWLLLELSRHPDIQQKLYSELEDIDHTQVSMDTLDGLTYLDSCIKEILRLYPPASSVTRKARAADIIGGYEIPAGTNVTLHFAAMMRTCVADGEVFRPDRFLETEYEGRKWLPFSIGPHACIGNKFALMEMKLFVLYLVHTFTFSPVPGLVIHRKRAILLKPSPDVELIASRRTQ